MLLSAIARSSRPLGLRIGPPDGSLPYRAWKRQTDQMLYKRHLWVGASIIADFATWIGAYCAAETRVPIIFGRYDAVTAILIGTCGKVA